jgi:hypothetical protein
MVDHPLLLGDLIALVASYITTGKAYKSAVGTCRAWYATIASSERRHSYMNVISTLMVRHPEIDWRPHTSLSCHMTQELLDEMITAGTYNYISAVNPRLTIDFITKHKNHIDWIYLCQHTKYYQLLLEKFPLRINWTAISCNKNITCEFIEQHIDKMNFDALSYNEALTPKLIEKYEHKISWDALPYHPSFNMSFIEKYKDMIDIEDFSLNSNLTPEFIRENVDELNWSDLSENVALTMPLIREFWDKLDWDSLGYNPNLSLEFIKEYIDKLVGCGVGSMMNNPFITLDFIREYILPLIRREDSNWLELLFHPCATIEFLEEHFEKIMMELKEHR